VSNEDYLGIEIHRFYIRCPKCVAVIAFKVGLSIGAGLFINV